MWPGSHPFPPCNCKRRRSTKRFLELLQFQEICAANVIGRFHPVLLKCQPISRNIASFFFPQIETYFWNFSRSWVSGLPAVFSNIQSHFFSILRLDLNGMWFIFSLGSPDYTCRRDKIKPPVSLWEQLQTDNLHLPELFHNCVGQTTHFSSA